MIKITIICNGCGKEGASSMGVGRKKAHEMRSALKNAGWKNATTHGEIGPGDYCPKCWKERKLR